MKLSESLFFLQPNLFFGCNDFGRQNRSDRCSGGFAVSLDATTAAAGDVSAAAILNRGIARDAGQRQNVVQTALPDVRVSEDR